MAELAANWSLILVICGGLILIGHLADFLLRDDEAESWLRHLERWAKVLRETSLREWQIRITTAAVSTLHVLHEGLRAYVGNYLRFAPPSFVPRHRVLVFFRIAFDVGFVSAFALYWFFDLWFFGVVGVAFLVVLTFGCLRALLDAFDRPEWTDTFADYVVTVPLLSTLISASALAIAIQWLPAPPAGNLWFALDAGGATTALRPLTLTLLNLPFDFLTIFITLHLLQLIKRSGRFILLVALLDIAMSALLAIAFYAILKGIESGSFIAFVQLIGDAFAWFYALAQYAGVVVTDPGALRSASTIPDVHLVPMLMSTFVPVTLYMTVFVLLSVFKPIMWLAERVFERLAARGREGTTVFKQFATLLSAIVAFAKLVFDHFTA